LRSISALAAAWSSEPPQRAPTATRPPGAGELDSLKSTLDRLAARVRSQAYKKALADLRAAASNGSKPTKRVKATA
jgi:hypothetical protein